MCGRVLQPSDYSEIKIQPDFGTEVMALDLRARWNKPHAMPNLSANGSSDARPAQELVGQQEVDDANGLVAAGQDLGNALCQGFDAAAVGNVAAAEDDAALAQQTITTFGNIGSTLWSDNGKSICCSPPYGRGIGRRTRIWINSEEEA
jgi:hypothetical protein